MLDQGIAIGHAGDIVRDDARPSLRVGDGRLALPLRRQRVGLGHEQIEQAPHDPPRLAGLAIDLVVPVDADEQEIPERLAARLHLRRKGDNRPARMANVVRAFGPAGFYPLPGLGQSSEEHTSELQYLMRISYAVFCLKQKKKLQARSN